MGENDVMNKSVQGKQFTIYGNTLTFSRGETRYYRLWDFFNHVEVIALNHLEKLFKECGSLEGVDKYWGDVLMSVYIESVIEPTIEYLNTALSINTWDINRLADYCDECTNPLRDALYDLYADPYIDIVYDKETAMQYRKDRKKNRIKYKGYGFTLEGKIKASMKAGAKNAVTGLGHTAVNAVGNAMSQVEASVKLMSIYNDKNRYLKLKSACSQMVFRVFKKVQIINDKESDIKVVPLTNENVKKAEAIFNNIQNGVIKESDASKAITQVLQCYPNYGEAYFYAIERWGDRDGTLKCMAKAFFVDLDAYIEKCMEKAYGDTLKKKYTDENSLLRVKATIISKCEFYGISADNKYVQHLEKEWIEIDRKLRTVDGVEFATREEAQLYIQDKEVFNKFIDEKDLDTMNLLDEGVVQKLSDDAEKLEYKGDYFRTQVSKEVSLIVKPYIDKQALVKRVSESNNITQELRDILSTSEFYQKIKNRITHAVNKKHKLNRIFDYMYNDEEIIFAIDCSSMPKTWNSAVIYTNKKIVLMDSKTIKGVHYEEIDTATFSENSIIISAKNNPTVSIDKVKGVPKQNYTEWKHLMEDMIAALKATAESVGDNEQRYFEADRIKKRSDALAIVSLASGVFGVLTLGMFILPQLIAIVLGIASKKKAKHPWIATVGLITGIIAMAFVVLVLGSDSSTTNDSTENTQENVVDSENEINPLEGMLELEKHINDNMQLKDMANALNYTGIYMEWMEDDEGTYYCVSSDGELTIIERNMGCEILLCSSDSAQFSIYGLYCGMTLEQAEAVLDRQGAVDVTYEDDRAVRRYRLFDSYSILLSLGPENIDGISFCFYLED